MDERMAPCSARTPIEIGVPVSASDRERLRAGDQVVITGPVFTARDATHARLVAHVRETGELPYGLQGQTLFYAGPTPPTAGRPLGAVGPTTASRMDAVTPELLQAGITATIGKGPRSDEVRRACAHHGALYLAAVGGAAALLARCVTSAEVVGYPELGAEALMRVEVVGFPAFVAIDSHGGDLFAEATCEWRGASRRDLGAA